MTPAEHVARKKQSATDSAKTVLFRCDLVQGLRDLATGIALEIAFNDSTVENADVGRHLDAARAHVKAALVALATQSLFPDGKSP